MVPGRVIVRPGTIRSCRCRQRAAEAVRWPVGVAGFAAAGSALAARNPGADEGENPDDRAGRATQVVASVVSLPGVADRVERAKVDAREEQDGQDDEDHADDCQDDDQRPPGAGT